MNNEPETSINSDADDAEGNLSRHSIQPADATDDTEGNGLRHTIQPADATDDTEGNVFRH